MNCLRVPTLQSRTFVQKCFTFVSPRALLLVEYGSRELLTNQLKIWLKGWFYQVCMRMYSLKTKHIDLNYMPLLHSFLKAAQYSTCYLHHQSVINDKLTPFMILIESSYFKVYITSSNSLVFYDTGISRIH